PGMRGIALAFLALQVEVLPAGGPVPELFHAFFSGVHRGRRLVRPAGTASPTARRDGTANLEHQPPHRFLDSEVARGDGATGARHALACRAVGDDLGERPRE